MSAWRITFERIFDLHEGEHLWGGPSPPIEIQRSSSEAENQEELWDLPLIIFNIPNYMIHVTGPSKDVVSDSREIRESVRMKRKIDVENIEKILKNLESNRLRSTKNLEHAHVPALQRTSDGILQKRSHMPRHECCVIS